MWSEVKTLITLPTVNVEFLDGCVLLAKIKLYIYDIHFTVCILYLNNQ